MHGAVRDVWALHLLVEGGEPWSGMRVHIKHPINVTHNRLTFAKGLSEALGAGPHGAESVDSLDERLF